MGWSILKIHTKQHLRTAGHLLRYSHCKPTKYHYSDFKTTEEITEYRKSPPWNIMFFGTDEFSVRSLEMLHKEQLRGVLINRMDVVSVVVKTLTAVRHYCQKERLQVIDWPVTVPQGVYDVGIVASFGHLIPPSIINAFPMGIINVHGSLLPRWRGATPVIHALLNQDHHSGITLMKIAPHRFDVGYVVSKVVVPVKWNIKSKELTAHLAEVGAQELLSILPNLPQYLMEACPQSSKGIKKAPKIKESASRVRWKEWSCSNVQAYYRALDDYTPLWSIWQETPIKLRSMVMQQEWSYSKENVETICDNVSKHCEKVDDGEVPGRVIYDRKRKEIKVRCRDGWVAFQHVVLKGRKLMTAQDFYNGFMSKVSKDFHRFT